jgi:membrane protease subunit HflK
MPWNAPGGGNNDRDPWSNKGGEQGPPDLDEALRKMQEKLSGLFGGGKGGKGGPTSSGPTGGGKAAGLGGAGLIGAALVMWLLYDMVHIINPAERGVVMRFGRYVTALQPGLNIRFPRPIEQVVRVDVDRIRTILHKTRMLTEDENIIEMEIAVQYKVKDAADYLFRVRSPDPTLKQATESALREIIGRSKMDYVLTEGRGDIVVQAREMIQQIIDEYQTGLVITSVNMQDAQPPEEVQNAFEDAIKAREDEQRFINEAQAYANDIIPKARGDARSRLEDAMGYRQSVIARAEGEASRFEQLLTEYKKSPEVTRQRLYLDAVEQVLANTSKVMVDVEGGNNLLYLPLDRLMDGHRAPEAATPGDAAITHPDAAARNWDDLRKRRNLRRREVRR